jgi:hypothetical protein
VKSTSGHERINRAALAAGYDWMRARSEATS